MNRFRVPSLVLLIVWLFGLGPSIFSRLNTPGSLEIFEIKLCEDSETNGVKIPGGSKVTFIPHKSRGSQTWLNISCINPGAKMEYRGVIFKKGEKLLTLSKTFRPQDPYDRASECEVNVWNWGMIETLKKSGMIK